MDKQLQSQMALRLHLKRGFTLLEMMLFLFITSILFSLSYFVQPQLSINTFEDDYLLSQLKAMSYQTTVTLKSDYESNSHNLSFNAWGNVNQAQTIIVNQVQYTIQLGAGRYDKK